MNLVRNTLLFIAMTVVMAHAVIAHTHLPANAYNTPEHLALHQQANSFLDYIGLAFHHEGANTSMETYQTPHEANPEMHPLQLAFVLHVVFNFPLEENSASIPAIRPGDRSHSFLFASALSRRGPPSPLV